MINPDTLASIVKNGGVSYRQSSQSWIFECPRCGKKDKLYLRKTTGQFICFVCSGDGFKGRPEFALREIYKKSIRYFQTLLYGVTSPDSIDDLQLDFADHWNEYELLFDIPNVYPGLCRPPDFYEFGDHQFEPGLEYLKKRDISEAIIKKYDILYSPKEHRVIFPIYHDGKLMGYQGRFIKNTEYIDYLGNTRIIPKALTEIVTGCTGKLVMFEDRLRGAPHAIITEGPFDALRCDILGGNIATMGRIVTDSQIRLIGSYTNKVYIGLDPDAGKDISHLIQKYSDDFEFYLLQPPPHREDLGDCTEEEILEAFQSSPKIDRASLVFSLGSHLVF